MTDGPTPFDRAIDRRGTDSLKWDLRPRTRSGLEVLPMWVADMDFPCSPAITRRLLERAGHACYGYTLAPRELTSAFCEWQRTRNAWPVEPEWVVPAASVMPAVRAAILEFTAPGDGVILQPPVYAPFYDAVRENGRAVVENPLVCEDGRYRMDLDGLRALAPGRAHLLLLCSPHNPVARVWTKAELAELAAVCAERGILVVSDEIHSDIVRPGRRFVPFACVSPEASAISIACHAPNKTFNIAGLAVGLVVVPDPQLRRRFALALARFGLGPSNTLSYTAAQAAYEEGGEWVGGLLRYLDASFDRFAAEVARRFDGEIALAPAEGTFLAWLDMRRLLARAGADDESLGAALFEGAGLWLSDGPQFGPGGAGHRRMNLGAPWSTVAEGLDRLERAAGLLSGAPPRPQAAPLEGAG